MLLFTGSKGLAVAQSVTDSVTHEIGFLEKLMSHEHQDSTFVQPFSHSISPRLLFGNKVTTFGFGRTNANRRTRYYPNVASFLGAGIFYKTIGFNVNLLLADRQSNRVENFGKTRYFDIDLKAYRIKFTASLGYQSYRGFFLANPKGRAYPTSSVEAPYPQRADIVLRNLAFSYMGIANWERFSLQAAVQNTKRQMRSAGSFLYSIQSQYLAIRGDSVVNTRVANTINKHDGDTIGFTRGQFLILNPKAGYGHTFVLHRFYVMGLFLAGPGIQFQHLPQRTSGRSGYVSPLVGTTFQAALGYNGDRFFTSILLHYNGTYNYVSGIRLEAATNGNQLLVGYRF